jgi:hypothetical protein
MLSARRRLDRLTTRPAARPEDESARRWKTYLEARSAETDAFLGRIPAELRAEVVAAFDDPDRAEGLDEWVLRQVADRAELPGLFPLALVRVMLDDPEASLLHECERCGLGVPIRAGCAQPFKPAVTLFPACPACGGRTGYDAYRKAPGGVT